MAGHTVPHSVKPVLRRQAVYGAGMSETSIGIGRIRNGPGPLGIGTGRGGAVHWWGSESFPATM
jgi:hypothetical protein